MSRKDIQIEYPYSLIPLFPYFPIFLLPIIFLISCEKDITVDLPQPESKIVVEGSIEPGQPPFILLTRNMAYFGPTDISTFENQFVHGADVTVSDGTVSVKLDEICSNDIPDSLLPVVSALVGIPLEDLQNINYCIYSTFNSSIWGQSGGTYWLTINAEGKTITSYTTIPQPVPLDSLWFKVDGNRDSLGYIWMHLSDPDTIGNYYRILTKRLNKDPKYYYHFGSTIEDKFFNGTSFDLYIDRGHDPGSETEENTNIEHGYFKKGDTVVVKWSSMDKRHFDFWRTIEIEAGNNGNPFASPSTIRSNINGGLGIWGGYGAVYDTVVAK